MKFQGVFNDQGNLVNIQLVHGESVLVFGAKLSMKRTYQQPEMFFDGVNNLLSNYTEREHDQLFNYYNQVYYLTLHKSEFEELQDRLEEIILGIFGLVLPAGIEAWGYLYEGFKVPAAIRDLRETGNYPKSSTYSVDDYKALCALSTMFKILLPIFCSFVDDFHHRFGVKFKEYRLLKLLDGLELEELKSLNKLKAIVSDGGKIPMGLVSIGIGAHEYPKYILSTKLIRDLAFSETDIAVRDKGEANNLTAKMSAGINTAITAAAKEHDYRDKELPNDRPGIEGGNTTKQETIEGQQQFSNLFGIHYDKLTTSDMLIRQLDLDPAVYEKFLNHIEEIRVEVPEAHFPILGLVIHNPVMPVQSLELLSAASSRRVLAATCAKLHEMKLHSVVSCLLTRTIKTSGSIARDMRQFAAAKSKPDAALLRQANSLYPELNSGETPLMAWLDKFVEQLCQRTLETCAPIELHESYQIKTGYVPDVSIKDQLLTLSIWSNTESNE